MFEDQNYTYWNTETLNTLNILCAFHGVDGRRQLRIERRLSGHYSRLGHVRSGQRKSDDWLDILDILHMSERLLSVAKRVGRLQKSPLFCRCFELIRTFSLHPDDAINITPRVCCVMWTRQKSTSYENERTSSNGNIYAQQCEVLFISGMKPHLGY